MNYEVSSSSLVISSYFLPPIKETSRPFQHLRPVIKLYRRMLQRSKVYNTIHATAHVAMGPTIRVSTDLHPALGIIILQLAIYTNKLRKIYYPQPHNSTDPHGLQRNCSRHYCHEKAIARSRARRSGVYLFYQL